MGFRIWGIGFRVCGLGLRDSRLLKLGFVGTYGNKQGHIGTYEDVSGLGLCGVPQEGGLGGFRRHNGVEGGVSAVGDGVGQAELVRHHRNPK